MQMSLLLSNMSMNLCIILTFQWKKQWCIDEVTFVHNVLCRPSGIIWSKRCDPTKSVKNTNVIGQALSNLLYQDKLLERHHLIFQAVPKQTFTRTETKQYRMQWTAHNATTRQCKRKNKTISSITKTEELQP